MAAEKRKVKKWGWKTLLALLGLAAAGAFGFFSIFNTCLLYTSPSPRD